MVRLGALFALVKALFMTALVSLLATTEPFWHQALLVFGSATVTATAIIVAALLGARNVERTVQETHRHVMELKKQAGLVRRGEDP